MFRGGGQGSRLHILMDAGVHCTCGVITAIASIGQAGTSAVIKRAHFEPPGRRHVHCRLMPLRYGCLGIGFA